MPAAFAPCVYFLQMQTIRHLQISSMRFNALVVFLSALIGSNSLFARDTVQWGALDFPPFQVRDGEYQGSGSFDGLLQFLIEQMPEYDHKVLTMTFARREEQIRQGQPLCTPGLFRTPEREKYLTFSLPALIHLDNRLVYLSSKASRLEGTGPVRFEDILKRADLVGGFFSQRSFAPNIDPLIKQYENNKNVVLRPLRSSQMFEMLINGEIDYTILFPHEAAYLARKFSGSPDIVVRRIAGTPPYIFTHVACTKGPLGDAVIGRIDDIVRAKRQTPAYRALSERWYGDSDKVLIRRYYPNLLLPEAGRP